MTYLTVIRIYYSELTAFPRQKVVIFSSLTPTMSVSTASGEDRLKGLSMPSLDCVVAGPHVARVDRHRCRLRLASTFYQAIWLPALPLLMPLSFSRC